MFSLSKMALIFSLGAAALTSATPLLNDIHVEHNEIAVRDVDANTPIPLGDVIQTFINTLEPIATELSAYPILLSSFMSCLYLLSLETYTEETITKEQVGDITSEILNGAQDAFNSLGALVGASREEIIGVDGDINDTIRQAVTAVNVRRLPMSPYPTLINWHLHNSWSLRSCKSCVALASTSSLYRLA